MSNDDHESGVGEDDCTEDTEQSSDDAEESFDAVDEMYEAFPGRPLSFAGGSYTTSEAKLPHPNVDEALEDAHAPPFTHDNQICIADRSSYVIRNKWGDVLASFEPEQVSTSPSGADRVAVKTAVEKMDLSLKRVRERWAKEKKREGELSDAEAIAMVVTEGMPFGDQLYLSEQASALADLGGGPRISLGWIEVEPVRRQCEHYLRQLEPPAPSMLSQGYTRGTMRRYCTVRRTVAGAFMSLENREMGACDARQPYDDRNTTKLEEFDNTALERSRDRVGLPMFNLASQQLLSGGQPTTDENAVS